MPHAVTKGTGLQALILCGPGSSFPTFTANPDENPKALLPIANRPMVWYPLDFCNRAGITDVTLISPPSSSDAIKAALSTNPFLTSLPAPTVLAPKTLDNTTGTAAVLRLPEVRDTVKTDFMVLPCDLVCELGGEKLLQAWMVKAASLADLLEEPNVGTSYPAVSATSEIADAAPSLKPSSDTSAHSGGLGVWYDTRSGIPTVKSEEKDFVATVPLPVPVPKQAASELAPSSHKNKAAASLLPHLERVVTAMPTDSLNDLTEEKDGYPTRHGLLRKHRAVRMRTTHRDAHIYIFPHWVMDFVQENEYMDNIGEDVVGWWAKAEWQRNLPQKLGVDKALKKYGVRNGDSDASSTTGPATDESNAKSGAAAGSGTAGDGADGKPKSGKAPVSSDGSGAQQMPPIIAYVHPSGPTAPLIRRVDTSQLLLTVSLQLAKLPSIEETAAAAGLATDSAAALSLASPFAHTKKVAYPEGVKARTTVTRPDSLVAENVTVEEKVSIKECVVGANCQIHEGAKLHQCLLMEGVVVGKGARLTRCILGKRSEIGAQSVLVDCEVQENMLVEPKSKFKVIRSQSSLCRGVVDSVAAACVYGYIVVCDGESSLEGSNCHPPSYSPYHVSSQAVGYSLTVPCPLPHY